VGDECLFDATVEVVIERGLEFGLGLPGMSVDDAGNVSEATTGIVTERGPEFGLGLLGTPANDAGRACGIEESNCRIAAVWVVAVAGMVVQKCEGMGVAANAVRKVELEVDAAKEPGIGVSSVTEVVVVGVFVSACAACATNVDAYGQMVSDQRASRY